MKDLTRKKQNFKQAERSPIHYSVFIAIILGQIACGYALGISGEALTIAQNVVHLSDAWVGLIGAGSLIGLAGSSVMGKLADRFGRRGMLLIDMYIFTILSLCQLLVQNPWGLFIIRIALGLMMAIDYTVGNSWMVEWLPADVSSRAQSKLIIYWSVGFVCSYLVGSFLAMVSPHSWQLILATSAVPGLITAIFRHVNQLPASPIWVATHVNNAEAEAVVEEQLGEEYGISEKLKKAEAPEKISWKILFTKRYRRQTLVGGLFYACQAFAFFGISIFLPILLDSMGLGNSNASGIIYNVCMLVGVFIGIFLFKRISRRSFLIGHFLFAALFLFLLVIGQQLAPLIKISCFALFSIILSSGLTLDYPYPTELFNNIVRATGVGTCITISRIGAAGGTFLLPVLTNVGGASLAMVVCIIVLVVGGMVCLIWAPETSPRFKKIK